MAAKSSNSVFDFQLMRLQRMHAMWHSLWLACKCTLLILNFHAQPHTTLFPSQGAWDGACVRQGALG